MNNNYAKIVYHGLELFYLPKKETQILEECIISGKHEKEAYRILTNDTCENIINIISKLDVGLYNNEGETFAKIMELIFKSGFNVTIKHFRNICNSWCSSNFNDIIKVFIDNKFFPDTQCLENILDRVCMAQKPEKNIIQLLIDNGATPNSKTLLKTCRYSPPEIIECILKGGVKPTPEHFNELCHNYKITDINLLFSYGLKFDTSFIEYANKFMLQNLSSLNILNIYSQDQITEDVINFCYLHDINMTNDMIKKFKPTIKNLENMCFTTNLKRIKHFIKNNKIKPNETCLENACSIKKNIGDKIIKYLINVHHVKTTFKGLKSYTSQYCGSILRLLANNC